MRDFEKILRITPLSIRRQLSYMADNDIYEIRFRLGRPVMIRCGMGEMLIGVRLPVTKDIDQAYILTAADLKEMIEYISSYSLYAFESQLKSGFITIDGGHRVGITGKVILEDNRIKTIRDISCINLRIAHQIKGCANDVIRFIADRERGRVYHTMIISPPGCGKTTLLRDIIRQISDGSIYLKGMDVSVVDERSELAACSGGLPANDVGIRTDILDCCPKPEGMLMLLRAMSPKVIALDEIGSKEDIHSIEYCINSGISLIVTVHGNGVEDVAAKPVLGNLVRNHVFERYIVLNGKKLGKWQVFDSRGSIL